MCFFKDFKGYIEMNPNLDGIFYRNRDPARVSVGILIRLLFLGNEKKIGCGTIFQHFIMEKNVLQ